MTMNGTAEQIRGPLAEASPLQCSTGLWSTQKIRFGRWSSGRRHVPNALAERHQRHVAADGAELALEILDTPAIECERLDVIGAVELGDFQRQRFRRPFNRWKAAAFARWHEPDESRGSSPEDAAVTRLSLAGFFRRVPEAVSAVASARATAAVPEACA